MKYTVYIFFGLLSGFLLLGLYSSSEVSPTSTLLAATNCSDGTLDTQCVFSRTSNQADKPRKCSDGQLVEDSQTCGCPSGYYAWGDGSCILRPHVKTYTHDLRYDVNNDTQFKATHFDQVFSHTAFKSTYKSLNPQIKIGTYRNFSAFTDNEYNVGVTSWCATQSPACDPEDLILHYQEDIGIHCDRFGSCKEFKGYNAACSPNCTPAATATTRAESSIYDFWDVDWKAANYNNPYWVEFDNNAVVNTMSQGGVTSDILLTDNGDWHPGGKNYDKTVEYYGIPLDSNHPRIQETFDAQRNLSTFISQHFGKPIPVVPNARATTWYLNAYLHDGYLSLNNPVEIESWINWNDYNSPSGGVPRATYYSIDYLYTKNIIQESLQGKKFFLQGINASTANRTKGQIFLLANFYLFNNENLAFAFRDATYYEQNGNFFPIDSVSSQTYVYIPAIEYDIGSPIMNTFDQADAFGNSNTVEHFQFATGSDPSTPNSLTSGATKNYYIFARQYDNALILAKWRDYGGLLGLASRTTHDLEGEYQRLNSDGTLDQNVITSITLENMEAAILIPYEAPDTTAPATISDLNAQLQ